MWKMLYYLVMNLVPAFRGVLCFLDGLLQIFHGENPIVVLCVVRFEVKFSQLGSLYFGSCHCVSDLKIAVSE